MSPRDREFLLVMAALRGERFNIDLSDDEEQTQPSTVPSAAPSIFGSLVKDIQERPPSEEKAPAAPSLSGKSSSSGFPEHKKRTGVSRFKAARAGNLTQDTLSPKSTLLHEAGQSLGQNKIGPMVGPQNSNRDEESRSIDEENKKRLASMSPAEIEAERKELMSSLSPALLKRLLNRANIDDDTGPQDFPGTAASSNLMPDTKPPLEPITAPKRVAFAETDDNHETGPRLPKTPYATSFPQELHDSDQEDDSESEEDGEPEDSEEQADRTHSLPSSTTHFPRPPQPPPTLDPSSPSFLTDLHTKYFPSLPSDPSKLAWMSSPAEPTADDPSEDHSYNPLFGADSIPVTQLRFGFTGDLLPPSVSIDIGVDKGLHHHGDNPEAAGYTIPELAHLARSSVPSQRCVSYQILGRILYRLGVGEFGGRHKKSKLAPVAEDEEDEDAGGENWQEGAGRRGGGNTVLETGMWDCMQRGRVIETLQEEVARERGHVSAKAYATEALWLWQKGGGKKVMAT